MADFGQIGSKNFDTGQQLIYRSNSDSTIILSILCANRFNGATDVTVRQFDDNGSNTTDIAEAIAIPRAASLELLANKYILPSGSSFTIETSVSGSLAYSMSYVVV